MWKRIRQGLAALRRKAERGAVAPAAGLREDAEAEARPVVRGGERLPRLMLGRLRQLVSGVPLESWLYGAFAASLTLWVATLFYSSLKLQIFYSGVRGDPLLLPDEWSAPLDDVFIHFDFARSAARGHPFEWSEGTGYSSGGTSLLYPFVLAAGYRVGFQGLDLMLFAGIVACVSVFATLLGARRLFGGLPWWASYLGPPALLGVGALDWTLFSGMEVAFFLAIWTGAVIAWDDLVHGVPDDAGSRAPPPPLRQSMVLGAWCAGIVATRPEAVAVVAVLSISASALLARRVGALRALAVLMTTAVPGALVVVGHSAANRIFTGEWSAAGALVKLEMHSPYLSPRAVWDAWKFHVEYQVLRVTHYHFAHHPAAGWLIWGVALVPLLSRKTRRAAVLLWASATLWVLTVALNGQVRWQNERYTMPAVAWLLLAFGLGAGLLFSAAARLRRPGARGGAIAAIAALLALVGWEQLPRFRDQVWFFGRASRNIRDQHVKTARVLQRMVPRPRRVLVGDAGAIPYVSDLPALDIIGLGGYADLPFARASRWGVAAAIELLERMPSSERPNVLAVYPSWWADLPIWFGRKMGEVPVRGNVICGGASKVLYRANWSAFEGSDAPVSRLAPSERVIDAVDLADIVSEGQRSYVLQGAVGHVAMKLLPNPERPHRDLWDAGRVLPPGSEATFFLEGFRPARPGRLILRTAPARSAELTILIDGAPVDTIALEPGDAWSELSVPLPQMQHRVVVGLRAGGNEVVVYHVWGVQRR